MSDISARLTKLKNSIPSDCTLVAVSKTKPIQAIEECYESGQRHFGENKVQELVHKAEHLPNDIKWHMIGHLQRNKVKYITPFVYLIHGVDSLKLLQEIDKRSRAHDRVTQCLLQIHIAEEESKFGFSKHELDELLSDTSLAILKNIQIKGLMGMATNTSDLDQVRKEFSHLRSIFEALKAHPSEQLSMDTLSMGMSNDYAVAIEEGSTMIRVGSALFGARN